MGLILAGVGAEDLHGEVESDCCVVLVLWATRVREVGLFDQNEGRQAKPVQVHDVRICMLL